MESKVEFRPGFSALVCIASVHTISGECMQEVPPVMYMYVSKEEANLNTFGFFKWRETEGESLRAVSLSTIKGFCSSYSWNGF